MGYRGRRGCSIKEPKLTCSELKVQHGRARGKHDKDVLSNSFH